MLHSCHSPSGVHDMNTLHAIRRLPCLFALLALLPADAFADPGPIKMVQLGEIPLPSECVALGVRPGTRDELWVSLLDGSLAIADPEEMQVVGRVPDVGSGSWGLAFQPDGSKVYGTNWMANELAVVDAATHKIERKILVGLKPAFVTVAADGKRAWVSDYFSGELSIVDLVQGRTLKDVDVGRRPMGLAVGPLGRWAYVSSGVGRTLTVVDLKTEEVAGRRDVAFAGTHNLERNADGTLLFAAGDPDYLLVLDARDPTAEVRRIQVGQDPVGIAADPWGRYVFVSNYKDSSLSVVDLAANRQVQTCPTEESPMFLEVGPAGRRLYVCNGKPKILSVYGIGDPETGVRPAGEAVDVRGR